MLCVEAFNIRFELYWYPFFQHALLAIGPGSGADADGMLNCCFCKHPKPHLIRGFKVSNDPMFEEKVTEIVGLYLDPPDRAVVLCVDEKSQIQALVPQN
jgi:hypothetical protein